MKFPIGKTIYDSGFDNEAKLLVILLPEDDVTNGPFILSEWNHNSDYSLTKNEYYWDAENVALDKVNVQIIESEATASSVMPLLKAIVSKVWIMTQLVVLI